MGYKLSAEGRHCAAFVICGGAGALLSSEQRSVAAPRCTTVSGYAASIARYERGTKIAVHGWI
jgi:hypothetical protein